MRNWAKFCLINQYDPSYWDYTNKNYFSCYDLHSATLQHTVVIFPSKTKETSRECPIYFERNAWNIKNKTEPIMLITIFHHLFF